ncbi:hypothetical protein P9112_000088 [Eukaryota sp. TZLM1-RC]
MSKQIIETDKAPAAIVSFDSIVPYSQAVAANGFLYVSGCLGVDSKTGDFVSDNVVEQCRCALDNMKAIVEAAGCTMEDVIKCSVFVQDMNDFAQVNTVYAEYFSERPPARECIQAACLPKNAKYEISAIAIHRGE